MLDTLLKLQGVQFIAGPVHTNGPKDFAEAKRAAHDVEACLPNLHEKRKGMEAATGESVDWNAGAAISEASVHRRIRIPKKGASGPFSFG